MAADTLREKLERPLEVARACVFDTYSNAQKLTWNEVEQNCRQALRALDQLAAILAESEEPRYLRPIPGLPPLGNDPSKASRSEWDTPEGQTHYVGDDCPGGHAEDPVARMLDAGITPEMSYPKAKLPLGHSFMAAVDVLGRKSKSSGEFCALCGQPRSAHESK